MNTRSKEKTLTFSSRCGCQQYNQVVLGLLKWVKNKVIIRILVGFDIEMGSKWGQTYSSWLGVLLAIGTVSSTSCSILKGKFLKGIGLSKRN